MKNERIDVLSALKVIAIFLIFYWHSALPKCTLDVGARCCEFFFIVSGFLTAFNLNSHKSDIQIAPIMKKKLRAVYPLHLCTFLIALIFFDNFDITKVFFNLLLIQSWALAPDIYFSYNGISWFLSSLLFCYFISLLVMKHLPSSAKSCLFMLLVIFVIRLLIEVLPSISPYKLWTIDIHVNPLIRMFEFLSGMFLFPIYIHFKKCQNLNYNLCEGFSFLLIAIMCAMNLRLRCLYIPFWCLFILSVSLQKGNISHLLSNRFILWFAPLQFYFFMFHQVVLRLGLKYLKVGKHPYIYTPLLFIATVLISLGYKRIYQKIKAHQKESK